MTASAFRVFLKVDCDTYVGTRDGVPRLLDLFARLGIPATFYFSFGPDRSGVAITRVFTRPGFLRKMWKSRAASLYGWRTALSGTLLPAPRIGERCASQMQEAARAGHETGVHAWDHVGWHDRLGRMREEDVRREIGLAHDAYRRVFGVAARTAAAAGWTVNPTSLGVEAERGLLFTSNTRGGAPFFPEAGGRVFPTLEIPSTLPTLDETLSRSELASDEDQRAFFREAVRRDAVHTIHAEVEGGAKAPLFEAILRDWRDAGAVFLPLSRLAAEALERRIRIPTRRVSKARLRGRAGDVATGWPETLS